MLDAILTTTDRTKINELMRQAFARLRRDHDGIPLVYLHTPYVTSKRISRWDPGSVILDLNIDGLPAERSPDAPLRAGPTEPVPDPLAPFLGRDLRPLPRHRRTA